LLFHFIMRIIKYQKPFWFYLSALAGALLIFTGNCKKDNEHVPELTTNVVSYITPIAAVCGGEVTSEGSSTVTAKGVCWSTDHIPTISDSKISDGTGKGSFTSTLTGLKANTKYYVRAYATNNAGTAFGSVETFTTPYDHTGETGIVKDIGGNVYQTIGIGSQIWMKENLKTLRFKDSSAIPFVPENDAWSLQFIKPAYCWYDNDEDKYKNTYGALYNWRAVITGNLCPAGWHVPTQDEWTILEIFLGGSSVAGGKMKESGSDHWLSPNTGATNESGFTALPGSIRTSYGTYEDIGEGTCFWTSTISNVNSAWYRSLDYMAADLFGGSNLQLWGCSIRCIKD
jgi:uncharacterized protein (TIGR02145 family)